MKIFQVDKQSVSSTWTIYKGICLVKNAFSLSLALSILFIWIFTVAGLSKQVTPDTPGVFTFSTFTHSASLSFHSLIALRFVYTNNRRCLMIHFLLELIITVLVFITCSVGAIKDMHLFITSSIWLPIQIMYTFMLEQMMAIDNLEGLCNDT